MLADFFTYLKYAFILLRRAHSANSIVGIHESAAGCRAGGATLYEGLTRFHDIFQGWRLAKDVCKR